MSPIPNKTRQPWPWHIWKSPSASPPICCTNFASLNRWRRFLGRLNVQFRGAQEVLPPRNLTWIITQKDAWEQVTPFKHGYFLVSMLDFWGVCSLNGSQILFFCLRVGKNLCVRPSMQQSWPNQGFIYQKRGFLGASQTKKHVFFVINPWWNVIHDCCILRWVRCDPRVLSNPPFSTKKDTWIYDKNTAPLLVV